MRDDTATRRLIDVQVLLGIGAFCLAERSVALGSVCLMAYIALRLTVRLGPRSPLPLPVWATNLGAVLAAAVMSVEATRPGAELVVAMGHFTILLQGLLLLGRRTLREEGQLLVLGLVQALAASVLSSTVFDGMALMAWCVVGAAALTRLSMRNARDRVIAHNGRLGQPNPNRPLKPPSIARTFVTGMVVASLVAAVLFVLTPRRESSDRRSQTQALAGLRGTGFSTRVELGSGSNGRVLDGPVLHVTLRQNGENIGSDGRSFLLRGASMDEYARETRSWVRSPGAARRDVLVGLPISNRGRVDFAADAEAEAAGVLRWEMELENRGGTIDTLFLPTAPGVAAGTPVSIRVPGMRSMSFNPLDRRVHTGDISGPPPSDYVATVAPFPREGFASAYEGFGPGPDAFANGAGEDESDAAFARRQRPRLRQWLGALLTRPADPPVARRVRGGDPVELLRQWSVEPERVRRLAEDVLAAAGLDTPQEGSQQAFDRRRVECLEAFLSTGFEYALVNPAVAEGVDPVINFLFDRREGHCELFAAGLTALCRSIGLPARIATGYLAGEYNALGGYYVVRSEHAHAWAEVALGAPPPADASEEQPGRRPDPASLHWTTFDATPPASVQAEHQRAGPEWFRAARHLFEHLEYTWVSRVVAFDTATRARALAWLKDLAGQLFADRLGWTAWLPQSGPARAVLGWATAALAAAGCVAAAWALRKRRRREARWVQRPGALVARGGFRRPRSPGFYARLVSTLERQGIVRPAAATPAAWADELRRSDPERFAGLPEVTAAFYRARFGGTLPDAEQRRRIDRVIDGLARRRPAAAAGPTQPAGAALVGSAGGTEGNGSSGSAGGAA